MRKICDGVRHEIARIWIPLLCRYLLLGLKFVPDDWLQLGNRTGEIPSSLGSLTALTVMDLGENQLSGKAA